MKTTFKFITALFVLFITISVFANDLSTQLKSFHGKLKPDVEKLLSYYASNNQYLNALEMQQAAYIASKENEWEIAGFYCIARPMIAGLISKSNNYDHEINSRDMKVLRKYWKQLDNHIKPVKQNKNYKELKKLRVAELMPCDKLVRLKLINNTSLIKKSLTLYQQWRPILNKDYHHSPLDNINKSADEINSLFNQLNEIYIKANQDFIKLMAIPRYKKLKLLSYGNVGEMTKKLNEGKVSFKDLKKDPNFMKKMITFGNNTREMEQIEIDNLLFPEITWGSWY